MEEALNGMIHRVKYQAHAMEFHPGDMLKLAELLRPPAEDTIPIPSATDAENLPKTGYEIIASRVKAEVPLDEEQAPKTMEEFEAQLCSELDSTHGVGGRKQPQYTMVYQQDVSAEDVYLQMGPKNPGSASCERLVVRISLPGDKRENVDLNVDKRLVTVESAQHALRLPLPHPVDPDGCRASWDPTDMTLELNLKLEREFDYINF